MTSNAPKRRSARLLRRARNRFGQAVVRREATVVRGISEPARPSCSSARRISGWNSTGIAKINAGIELRSKNCSMVRLNRLLSTNPNGEQDQDAADQRRGRWSRR